MRLDLDHVRAARAARAEAAALLTHKKELGRESELVVDVTVERWGEMESERAGAADEKAAAAVAAWGVQEPVEEDKGREMRGGEGGGEEKSETESGETEEEEEEAGRRRWRRQRLQASQEEVWRLTEVQREWEGKIEALEQDIEAKEGSIQSMERDVGVRDAQIAALEQQLQETKDRLQASQEEVGRLMAVQREREGKIEALEQGLRQCRNKNAERQ
jgi:chromosome segregation ATPase